MLLVNISGIEGSGKSTASHAVKNFLEEKGIPAINTREPGGTPIAERIRDLVKDFKAEEIFDPMTELLLFYGARNQLFKNVITRFLDKGHVVISDRSYYCSFAYQVRGSGAISEQEFWAIHNVVMKNAPEYDLIIHLYTETAEEGMARARGRGVLDRIEENEIDFFKRADAGYREVFAGKKNVLSINTTINDEAAVQQLIIERLEQELKAKGL